ncbi:MAG: HepT-like ribonuclease domain-containing protein [Thermodesulfobacteriota bacterium]
MSLDKARVKKYLQEITRGSEDLKALVRENRLVPDSIPLKAVKYLLVELAEAISNTLQHILAKEKGIPVSGYLDTIVKGYEQGLISEDLFTKLKPFLEFRNTLVRRYWIVDDERLIENVIRGKNDFSQFVSEIEAYLESINLEE